MRLTLDSVLMIVVATVTTILAALMFIGGMVTGAFPAIVTLLYCIRPPLTLEEENVIHHTTEIQVQDLWENLP